MVKGETAGRRGHFHPAQDRLGLLLLWLLVQCYLLPLKGSAPLNGSVLNGSSDWNGSVRSSWTLLLNTGVFALKGSSCNEKDIPIQLSFDSPSVLQFKVPSYFM